MGLGLSYVHINKGSTGLNLLDIALGFAVAPNFIIYGEVTLAPGARIGPGVAYYLMPINMYFGGGLMLQSLPTNIGTISGFGIQGQFGKEWFVSPQWGIGAQATLNVGVMGDYNPIAFTAAFIATFN
jgi:hypothetical protein